MSVFVTCTPWQRDEVAILLNACWWQPWGLLNRRRLFVTDPDRARKAIGDRADWWETQVNAAGVPRYQNADYLRDLADKVWHATFQKESA